MPPGTAVVPPPSPRVPPLTACRCPRCRCPRCRCRCGAGAPGGRGGGGGEGRGAPHARGLHHGAVTHCSTSPPAPLAETSPPGSTTSPLPPAPRCGRSTGSRALPRDPGAAAASPGREGSAARGVPVARSGPGGSERGRGHGHGAPVGAVQMRRVRTPGSPGSGTPQQAPTASPSRPRAAATATPHALPLMERACGPRSDLTSGDCLTLLPSRSVT